MTQPRDFWARRRAAVAAEAEAEEAAVREQALAEEHAALEQKTDEEVLAVLDLPDPDTLTRGDDFSAFMAKAVPDAIRRRALRALWRSNPVLANVDMLVDYGEDFTDSATVVENMQTAYQVGKGMLKHVEEMTRQANEAEAAPPDEDLDALSAEQEVEENIVLAAVEEAEQMQDDNDAPNEEAEGDTEDPYTTPAPRRMKFKVEETA